MMIHQQLLPPQKPLPLHIENTSKKFLSSFAAHSMVFHPQKKVQMFAHPKTHCFASDLLPGG